MMIMIVMMIMMIMMCKRGKLCFHLSAVLSIHSIDDRSICHLLRGTQTNNTEESYCCLSLTFFSFFNVC